MANFRGSPRSHFKKAKDDLINWGENKISGGNADLLKAGAEGIVGTYELVEEKVKGYQRKDGTWVKPHNRIVQRKKKQDKRSSSTAQK
jgi:hypothetical protein